MGQLSPTVPGWVSPSFGGGGPSGMINEPDPLGGGGGDMNPEYIPIGFTNSLPGSSIGPQTMAEALAPPTQTPVPQLAIDDGTLNLQINQQTLIVGGLVAIGLFIFASR